MITVRKNRARRCDQGRAGEAWQTFDFSNTSDSLAGGFGILALLHENRIPPGAKMEPLPLHEGDVVTYVHEGAIAYKDSMGRRGVLQAGEFQCRAGGESRRERSASGSRGAHVFRMLLRSPDAGREDYCEQKRFSAADRRGRLCAFATPDARAGSLRVRQDALMYSALLDPGQHVVHELPEGRGAWVHVVTGAVQIGDFTLEAGDGAGVVDESAASVTALQSSAILIFDVSHARAPGREVRSDSEAPTLSGAAVFKVLWEALADVLGPAATATLVSRSARRASIQDPVLADVAVRRSESGFGYVLPPSFDREAASMAPLRRLFEELKEPLVQLTGQVVLRHLDRIPELQEWTAGSAP